MKWRATITIAVLAATLLMSGGAILSDAQAQSAATASVTAPSHGSHVSGTVTVSGGAGAGSDGLSEAQLYVGGVVVAQAGPFECPNSRSGANLSTSWDTTGGSNREETIKMRAVACGSSAVEDYATVYVNNPPRDPSGVSASVSGKTVTVTWNANPEPDIAGYEVARDGMSTTVTGTSFSEQVPPGTYTYRVTALRNGTHGVIRSSAVSSNSVTVEEPPPPPSSQPPSSNDPPDDSGGGGSGGGGSGGSDSGGTVRIDPDDPADGGSGDGSQGGTIKIPGGGTLEIPTSTVDTFDLDKIPVLDLDLPFSLASLPPLPLGLPPLQPPAPAKERGMWAVFEDPVSFEPPTGVTAGDLADSFLAGQMNIAARSPDRLLPPDQMRWLGVGLAAMVLAAVFWLLDVRLQMLAVSPVPRDPEPS